MKKNDYILLILCLLAGLALWGGFRLTHRSPGSYVTISIDGREYKTLPLSLDTELIIPGADGGSNCLTIKNEQASITDADCPDKLCVRQPAIHHNGESLICLPHKVIAEVHNTNPDDGSDDNGMDAIAR